ncbi:hypothetical protein ACTL32_13380 [Planococcus sp. FY231025]|uniref:hypothetical protein n=1 Tax=Planococcus sp. FY231025 TaxID=3455699 RepID=UPI003F8FD9CA
MEAELRTLVNEYVKGAIKREYLIGNVNPKFIRKPYHEDSIFNNLLEIIFDDPEDNDLEITRGAIFKVLTNYINNSISIEEVELWFWDVLNLNISGDIVEEELIAFLIYLFDNLEINRLTDGQILDIIVVLEIVPHPGEALDNIKKQLKIS